MVTPTFVNCYYFIFVVFAVSANGLFIFLVKYRSPQSLNDFKFLLINTAVNQILLVIQSGFLQQRLLPSGPVLALLPVGPCRLFGPTTCFVVFNIGNALSLNAALSVINTMYFRYRLIHTTQLSQDRIRKNVMVAAVLPLILAIAPHFEDFRFDFVMEMATRFHPEEDVKAYGNFGGMKSITNPIYLFTILTLFATSVILPALILYWRRLILKTINASQQSLSEKTKYNSKRFLKALTTQAVVPLICLVPTGVMIIIMQFLHYNFVFLQYIFPVVTMLPCAIDPVCSIYFITPYRGWVRKKLRIFPTPWSLRASCFPNGNATRIAIDSNKL